LHRKKEKNGYDRSVRDRKHGAWNKELETMKTRRILIGAVVACVLFSTCVIDAATDPTETVFETRPLGIELSVKMVGPYMNLITR
jgi:hypothetical protein